MPTPGEADPVPGRNQPDTGRAGDRDRDGAATGLDGVGRASAQRYRPAVPASYVRHGRRPISRLRLPRLHQRRYSVRPRTRSYHARCGQGTRDRINHRLAVKFEVSE